ncbi:MAG: flagellin [Myxococcota bacterium]|nr:flagellin [Myxococcota bacterium]
MGISIVSNVSSLNGQRQLSKTQRSLDSSLQRLTSGFRINSAMDDAAGLGVSEQMRAQIRGLSQAARNANDGLSVVQTAESAMGEISGVLIRMRELTVQSASDSISDTERDYLDTEFQELILEINRIAATTKFNGNVLLNGAFAAGTGDLDFQVGIESGANFKITVNIDNVSVSGLGFAGGEDVKTKATSLSAMNKLDSALKTLSTARSNIGAKGNRLQVAGSAAEIMRENLSAANSRIRDTDVAHETSVLSRTQVLMQAGTAMLAQANQQPQMALALIGGG